jgi:hypothetical protein
MSFRRIAYILFVFFVSIGYTGAVLLSTVRQSSVFQSLDKEKKEDSHTFQYNTSVSEATLAFVNFEFGFLAYSLIDFGYFVQVSDFFKDCSYLYQNIYRLVLFTRIAPANAP